MFVRRQTDRGHGVGKHCRSFQLDQPDVVVERLEFEIRVRLGVDGRELLNAQIVPSLRHVVDAEKYAYVCGIEEPCRRYRIIETMTCCDYPLIIH